MSQTPKRPGTRDISELKARLGLKKAAPEAGKAPASQKPSGGVAPPPGLNVPSPARPSGPVIPAASDDPFGNMNAMAQIGTMQRAPEIVIVNDGKPVESVSTGSSVATIGKYVAIALVPLILGWQIGAIGKSASVYNDGIVASQKILGNLGRAKKDLSDTQQALNDALKKSGGKIDPTVTKVLQDAMQKPTFKLSSNDRGDAVKEPEENQAKYRIPQGTLDPVLSGRVVAFYAHVTELAQLIDTHVRAAKTDDLAIAQGDKAADAATTTINDNKMIKYAVVLSNPTEDDVRTGKAIGNPGAMVVEIGPQLCADRTLAQGGVCSQGSPGLGYRTDPSGSGSGSQYAHAEIAKAQPGQPYPLNAIIQLAPTPILDTLVKGASPSATELMYQQRVQNIAQMIEQLLKEGNELEGPLKIKANEGKKFSFFL